MGSNEQVKPFEHFRKWQAIYAILFAVALQFMMYGSRIESLEDSEVKQDARIEINTLNGAEIKARLASIETSLEFIKQALKDK